MVPVKNQTSRCQKRDALGCLRGEEQESYSEGGEERTEADRQNLTPMQEKKKRRKRDNCMEDVSSEGSPNYRRWRWRTGSDDS